MIEYIRGIVTSRTPASAVIEANGVGYLLSISLNSYNLIREGEEVTLLVHEVIREDMHELYGFAEESERRLFRLLITVKGIGPASGRLMISSFPPKELSRMIAEGDELGLKSIKGVGTRTAQQIIVELKSKVESEMSEYLVGIDSKETAAASAEKKEMASEAEKAFIALGYTPAASRKVITKLLKESPTLSLNDLIRQGLRLL
ncbi:Holliday junction branch migration protein RuvA [Porphyromonadaceae bacterium W3.11]|nr:Holliday junction branch migration protein RuvA [Porphyromonadaceae bacterium W3.11]